MKKLFLRIGIVLLVLLIIAVLAVNLFLDGAVKRGVEKVGPQVTQVSVKLDSVNLSLLSGSGTLKGLVVGNPEGYQTPQSIGVGSASISLKPRSLFSDKVVIQKIELIEPDITFEGSFSGNNLSKLLDNINSAAGSTDTNATPEAARKLQVDDFVLKGAKLHVSITGAAARSVTVPIPDIHLTNLGQGPEGITAAELSKLVLTEVVAHAIKAADAALANIGKETLNRELDKAATEGAKQIGKGIGDLLKRNTN